MEKTLSAALKQFGEICYKIVKGNITKDTFEILHIKENKEPGKSLNDSESLSGLWASCLISDSM